MILQKIDKNTYRKHLNRVIVAIIASMLLITLCLSTLLIHLIGNPEGSNFSLNLTGVVVAASIVGTVLYKNRLQPFMTEVFYVLSLKQ
jgi:ABC-type sulfate transport system permease component